MLLNIQEIPIPKSPSPNHIPDLKASPGLACNRQPQKMVMEKKAR
jgi:hypothetical protein